MNIFAISDLHLGLGINKKMDVFGPLWGNHSEKIRHAWQEQVMDEDIVLIPGDISWAMNFEQARKDIDFIRSLPAMKVIIRGNHDYWWSTLTKLRSFLPENIVPLQNTSFVYRGIGIAGTRLWIDPGLRLESASVEDEKIFKRELTRLKMSLESLNKDIDRLIVMTHFPPVSIEGTPGRAIGIAEEYAPCAWVFGHMHLNGSMDYSGFNRKIGKMRLQFVSADFLDFRPRLVLSLE